MYKRHKVQLYLVAIVSMIVFIGFNINLIYLNLIAEVISINSAFLILYTLSLTGLTKNEKLCKNLSNEMDKKLYPKSKIGVIISYYKLGYYSSILSIGLIYISNLFLKSNIVLYILSLLSFSFLNINLLILICIIQFMLNFQLRRFE